MSHLLLIALFLPVVGALLCLVLGDAARWVALLVSLVVAGVVGVLVVSFPGTAEPFAVTDVAWSGWASDTIDLRFHVGIDGLSVYLFGLTAVLSVVAVAVGWESIKRQASTYHALLLLLETGMLGVFVSGDLILFFVFFEFTLIPLFFLIGIWGSDQRRFAAVKFFLYTLVGSVLTFLGLLAIVLWDYHHGPDNVLRFSIAGLTEAVGSAPIDPRVQLAIFAALFVGFAVKVPLFPLHTWLPLAHVEAPTAGSVLLAGVLLKIGTYGFCRFSLPMLPDATAVLAPWLVGLAVVGILYGAMVALAQTDMKRLIAYSSVSHMGFCMAGIFAINRLGMQGSVLQMLAHGLATGGLFAMVGMLYERFHTRRIADYGGMARRMPRAAFFMMILTLAAIGLPGTGNFAGEMFLLVGLFQRAWTGPIGDATVWLRIFSVGAVFGVVLGAWYMLWLYQRVFFGATRVPKHDPGEPEPTDLRPREIATLLPVVVLIVVVGVCPNYFTSRMAPTLERLIEVQEPRPSFLGDVQPNHTARTEHC